MVENEAPKKLEEASGQTGGEAEAAPLTREELAAKLDQLAARARAAGMSPLQAMISTYARRGMTMLDVFLSSLEDGSSPKKPSATEAKAPDAAKKEG